MSAPLSPPAVLLSALAGPPSDALRGQIQAAGFVVVDHRLGSTPPVDFAPITVAVIDVRERIEVAAAQTRRWRIELGDSLVPVLWVLPGSAPEPVATGLDAGADLCLIPPHDPALFAAQIRAADRTRAAFARQAIKAAEARLLGDQLQKAYRQLDLQLDLARRIHRACLPRTLARVGSARFSVWHRPRSRAGGDFYDVQRLDEDHVGFFLADVMGHSSGAGSLIGTLARQAVRGKDITGNGYRLVSPEDVLAGVNRELLSLGLEDPPFMAMLYGLLNARTGELRYARAGLPPPIFVPHAGEPEVWPTPGPFLGVFDAAYTVRPARLAPGDRLLLGTDGTRPEADGNKAIADPVRQAAALHRETPGPAFVDAVARELLSQVQQPDDFTLLAVEFAIESDGN